MSNKKLILIFGVLVAIYLISRLFTGNRESTFDPQLVKVDTATVTEIHLFPKAEENAEVVLKRTLTAGLQRKVIRHLRPRTVKCKACSEH